jgi:transcriptional regulator with XRE-family HTH domain
LPPWYLIGYHHLMTAAQTLKEIRRRSGLGLRELARRGGTSHATLHAYESGAKEPRLDTVARLADAAGFTLEVTLAARPDAGAARADKGRELAEALELAAAFPARHHPHLRAPIFGALP